MNILLPLTILVVSWSLDGTDPDVQNRIFFIFAVVHTAIMFMAIYLFFEIWRSDDNTLIQVKDPYTDNETVQRHWEYDIGKLRDLIVTNIGLSAGISTFLAFRYGVAFPLLLQSLNNPKAIYHSELFRVYVKKEKAEGQLQRPWKETNTMPEWAKTLWTQSEKDSEKLLASDALAPQSPTGGSKASRKRR